VELTRSSVGLAARSNGGRRTGFRPVLPSLDLIGPRWTLLEWSPMVGPMVWVQP
jgi:hypothetical protein